MALRHPASRCRRHQLSAPGLVCRVPNAPVTTHTPGLPAGPPHLLGARHHTLLPPRRPLGPCELVREDRGRRALGTGDSGRPLPEVVAVQLLSAVPVVLAVRALASGKLKPASRSGQEGSMANLQEAGTGWVTRSPPRRTHTEATAALRR